MWLTLFQVSYYSHRKCKSSSLHNLATWNLGRHYFGNVLGSWNNSTCEAYNNLTSAKGLSLTVEMHL